MIRVYVDIGTTAEGQLFVSMGHTQGRLSRNEHAYFTAITGGLQQIIKNTATRLTAEGCLPPVEKLLSGEEASSRANDLTAQVPPAAGLKVYAVFKSPKDFPGQYVCRLFVGTQPTATHWTGTSLEDVRQRLPQGLHHSPRTEADEPQLVETWL